MMIRGPILALRWVGPVALVLLATLLLLQSAGAQTRFTYSKGQSVSPAYEGWMPNEDGSFTLYFGYMNTNWLEEFDIPVGPDNNIEPGGPDQGQPTHFYPLRNPFLFTIRLPKDFGNKELIWTLTTHGRTEKAYASLKSDYQIDKQVISTEVGRDGKPQPRHPGERPVEEVQKPPAPRTAPPSAETSAANLVYRPPSSIVPSSGPGLRLSWIVYRGKSSAVTFSPEQMKTWTDTRAWANSPWSPPFTIPEPPPDGKWVTDVRFQEPGIYTLRAVASDGSLFTYENVIVTVSP